jgi:hypothetical protein
LGWGYHGHILLRIFAWARLLLRTLYSGLLRRVKKLNHHHLSSWSVQVALSQWHSFQNLLLTWSIQQTPHHLSCQARFSNFDDEGFPSNQLFDRLLPCGSSVQPRPLHRMGHSLGSVVVWSWLPEATFPRQGALSLIHYIKSCRPLICAVR